jgi:hypothetical protein
VKRLHGTAEHHRVSVRNIRRDGNENVKKLLKDKKITEDDEKRTLDEIQKLTDAYMAKVDQAAKIEREGHPGDPVAFRPEGIVPSGNCPRDRSGIEENPFRGYQRTTAALTGPSPTGMVVNGEALLKRSTRSEEEALRRSRRITAMSPESSSSTSAY